MKKRELFYAFIFAVIVGLVVRYSVEHPSPRQVCSHSFGEWQIETDAFNSHSVRLCKKCGRVDHGGWLE